MCNRFKFPLRYPHPHTVCSGIDGETELQVESLWVKNAEYCTCGAGLCCALSLATSSCPCVSCFLSTRGRETSILSRWLSWRNEGGGIVSCQPDPLKNQTTARKKFHICILRFMALTTPPHTHIHFFRAPMHKIAADCQDPHRATPSWHPQSKLTTSAPNFQEPNFPSVSRSRVLLALTSPDDDQNRSRESRPITRRATTPPSSQGKVPWKV